MDVVQHDDPRGFAARTEPFLMSDEARHNLLLGLTTTLIARPEVYPVFHLWVVEERGEVAAAAIETPPFNLAVSRARVDGAVATLAEELHRDGAVLPGVNGALPEADEFAEAWAALGGATPRLAMATRIHVLTTVKPVDGVSGRMRDATRNDRDLLMRWIRAFGEEALPNDDPMDPERVVDLRLQGTGAGLLLWEDGEPVALAGFGGRTPNGIRIGPVYTPPALRRRGYASALVAGLSQRLLDEGRTFCFLYTDLSNPTANRIYADIGYEPVCDSRSYRFDPPGR
jgi:predicted GNAT family acetyltransferase